MSSLDNSSLQQKLTEIVDNENAKLLEKTSCRPRN